MDLPINVQTKKIQLDSLNITIHYPIIEQFSNPDIQHRMNAKIISTLNELLLEQNYHSPNLVELVASYEIKTNERGIFSLNLIVYSFTGGAHGMTVVKSLTFDTASGNVLTLPQLFKSDSSYIDTISNEIKKDIQKWQVVVIEPFDTIKPDQDFYIADNSLVVYFQLYELAPYSSGFPYFPIPLLDLQKHIAPNTPLDKLLPFT